MDDTEKAKPSKEEIGRRIEMLKPGLIGALEQVFTQASGGEEPELCLVLNYPQIDMGIMLTNFSDRQNAFSLIGGVHQSMMAEMAQAGELFEPKIAMGFKMGEDGKMIPMDISEIPEEIRAQVEKMGRKNDD